MPPKVEGVMSETDSKLLAAIIKYLPSNAIDWQAVSDEIGASSATVKKQWSRYKLKHNIQQNGTSSVPGSATKPSGKQKKRKTPGDDDTEQANKQESEEMATPTKKGKSRDATKIEQEDCLIKNELGAEYDDDAEGFYDMGASGNESDDP